MRGAEGYKIWLVYVCSFGVDIFYAKDMQAENIRAQR